MSDDNIRVLVTIKFDEETIEAFQDISPRLEILSRPARTYTDIIADVWAAAEVLYTASVFPPVDAMPKLKWVQSHFAGVDSVLKQPIIADEPDVLVTSTRGIHATNIAEYVLSFLLMFGHHIPGMMRAQRQKTWEDDRFEKYMPKELRHATVGIVGYGAIGREVARLVKAFGGSVLATKRDAKRAADRDHFTLEGTGDPDGECFDRLYPPQALATMVRDCDFVVITTPYTEETANMYNARIFDAMKPGSYLVNVGRGGVVDEDALLEALKSGHVAGAAMDVFAQEPLPEDHPLWTAPNFILTPHLSGSTPDYNQKAAQVFEENLRRYVEGKPLLNLVDRQAGY